MCLNWILFRKRHRSTRQTVRFNYWLFVCTRITNRRRYDKSLIPQIHTWYWYWSILARTINLQWEIIWTDNSKQNPLIKAKSTKFMPNSFADLSWASTITNPMCFPRLLWNYIHVLVFQKIVNQLVQTNRLCKLFYLYKAHH